jgi:hypothetical protein
MREALKNLYSNQITLEDNSQFYYIINPYELTNALGNIVTVLQEYNFTKKDDTSGLFSCKLYKTKEETGMILKMRKWVPKKGF